MNFPWEGGRRRVSTGCGSVVKGQEEGWVEREVPRIQVEKHNPTPQVLESGQSPSYRGEKQAPLQGAERHPALKRHHKNVPSLSRRTTWYQSPRSRLAGKINLDWALLLRIQVNLVTEVIQGGTLLGLQREAVTSPCVDNTSFFPNTSRWSCPEPGLRTTRWSTAGDKLLWPFREDVGGRDSFERDSVWCLCDLFFLIHLHLTLNVCSLLIAVIIMHFCCPINGTPEEGITNEFCSFPF